MIDDIKKDANLRMGKSVESLRHALIKVRTGRANTSLLDHLRVDYYGSEVPLSQVANIGVGDARTLTVQPWEKNMVAPVEKAILNSDLGLNPATAGQVIRIPLPPLTEERRQELGKLVHHEGEQAKIAVRNIRRDAIHSLKELQQEKEISEDDEHRGETEVQVITDQHVAEIDKVVAAKEEELMEI